VQRLALMGPETMTDVIYYDVQQWYVDINVVTHKDRLDGYWNDTVTTVQPVDMTLHLVNFFDLSNNSENFFSASSRLQ